MYFIHEQRYVRGVMSVCVSVSQMTTPINLVSVEEY